MLRPSKAMHSFDRIRIILRASLGVALLSGLLFSSRVALADPTVAVNSAAVTRSLPTRNSNYNPLGINFSDCTNDLVINFPLTLTGIPNTSAALRVWAGPSDCTANAARTEGTTATCWQVLATSVPQSSATPVVAIHARDIVAHLAESPPPVGYPAAAASVCNKSGLPSGPSTVTLYFIWTAGGGAVNVDPIGTPVKYDLQADLVGPAAPVGLTAGVEDTALALSWTPSGDNDTQAFEIYCDPPRGGATAPATDASVDAASLGHLVCKSSVTEGGIDEAGNETGGIESDAGCVMDYSVDAAAAAATASSCASTVLVSGGGTTVSDEAGTRVVGGVQKDIPAIYSCGSATGSMTKDGVASGLTNGVTYTVALAAMDNYENMGPLSNPACGTPEPVDDFFKVYRDAGGGAGGGYCSLEGVGMPAGTTMMGIGMIWSAITLVRRRRRS